MSGSIPIRRYLVAVTALFLLLCIGGTVAIRSQQADTSLRLSELRRLRDDLRLTKSLRQADVILIMGERPFIEGIRQLVGLEIKLSNGSVVKVTSFDGELQTAAAVVKIGLQAKAAMTVNVELIGRAGTGERGTEFFSIPYQITKVNLLNGRFSSFFLKSFFGEWLAPKKWNEELPNIEFSKEIAESMAISASKLIVDGSVPVEISTPEYNPRMRFVFSAFQVFNKRVVMALNLVDENAGQNDGHNVLQTSFTGTSENDPYLIESEIESMASHLVNNGDLRIRMSRRLVNRLLSQITGEKDVDFDIKLKPGRLRTDEVNALISVTNYTDVESGEGRADIKQLSLERIEAGKILLKLSGNGEIDSQLRGKEFGIPYSLSPRTTFSVKDGMVPMQFVSEGDHFVLQAVPGSTVPMDLRFSLMIAGRDIGINRNLQVQADQWLKRVKLPSFFGREIMVPVIMEIDAGGNVHAREYKRLEYALSKLRIDAGNDAIDFVADVLVSEKETGKNEK